MFLLNSVTHMKGYILLSYFFMLYVTKKLAHSTSKSIHINLQGREERRNTVLESNRCSANLEL